MLSPIENKISEIGDKRRDLFTALKELDRNSIEYHKGDLLVLFNDSMHYQYHEDIIEIYEVCDDYKKQESSDLEIIHWVLHNSDDDLSLENRFDTMHISISEFESSNSVYLLKSSATSDVFTKLHELVLRSLSRSGNDYPEFSVDNIPNEFLELVIAHDGKLLKDIIDETKNYEGSE